MSLSGSVLLTDRGWPDASVESGVLARAGLDVVEAPVGASEDVLTELASDVSAIMTCWATVTRRVIEASATIRAVVRMGVGLDNIDLQAAADTGCVVANVPDYCVEEVSDHVVAMVHAWARGIVYYDRDIRAGEWSPGTHSLRRVSDLTVGILGLGRIGRRSADKLNSLGCRVLGIQRGSSDRVRGVELVPQDELLTACDVVVLHVPLTPQTHHLIDERFLSAMRAGSLLINVSRGGLVDTTALAAGLRSGRPGAAALDVLDTEPTVPDDLLTVDNVIITPHVAFSSDLAVGDMRRRAAEEVVTILAGNTPRNPVTLPLPSGTREGGTRDVSSP